MSTGLTIAIVVVAVVLLLLLLLWARRAREHRKVHRERLAAQAGGHRTEAERHTRRAEEERVHADRLAEEADQAAQRVSREDELARHHGGKAQDLEDKL